MPPSLGLQDRKVPEDSPEDNMDLQCWVAEQLEEQQ